MSYLFIDCYAGLDMQMLIGAFADMQQDEAVPSLYAQRIIPHSYIELCDVKRRGMDACLATLHMPPIDNDDILGIIDAADTDDETKSRLRLWHKIKSDGKKTDFQKDCAELAYVFIAMEYIKSLEPSYVYCSAILQGSGLFADGDNVKIIPSTHTELLAKMTALKINHVPYEKEILTPGALAFLYVTGAKAMAPRAHDVIKSGYGAGAEEYADFPNITRCVLANDFEEELKLGFEEMISCFEDMALI